jgi:rod shape determining protein RodA
MRHLRGIDYTLLIAIIPLLVAGLVTMNSFSGAENGAKIAGDYFFVRQLVWIAVSFGAFLLMRSIDWRFLKSGALILTPYIVGVLILLVLAVVGGAMKGAVSWFNLGFFALEPAEPMKIITILILAKYFSRRHIAIANVKHIFVSLIFAGVPALIIFLQPDFGSAMIFAAIWLGMVMASGIRKKHFFAAVAVAVLAFLVGWFFVLAPYQQMRVLTFVNPFLDPRGAGYNALQAEVAVGSGGLWGKGIGEGTQSRLKFLPEHETDFIFAAFAEEWGFVGVILLFTFFGIVLWRIMKVAFIGHGNFERLYAMGFASMIFAHIFINIGMNMGLLPITGITLPFMSYGGSALVTLFAGLGILDSMRLYSLEMPGKDERHIFIDGV